MNIPRPIDAELVTLLHEITDNPTQLLASFTNRLRSTKHEPPKGLALDEDAFFNQAERRMLRRHREEIGDLLYERCLQFMQETPDAKSIIMWGSKGRACMSVERKLYVQQRIDSELKSVKGVAEKDAISGPISHASLASLCELAFRMKPSFWSKSLIAMALKKAGKFTEALSLLETMHSRALSLSRQGVVLENKAFVLCAQGDLEQARIFTRQAHSLDYSRPRGIANWAIMELCCGTKNAVLESSNELALYGSDAQYDFDQFEHGLIETNSEYRPNIAPHQFELIQSVLETLPPPARKFANAIL